MASDSEWFLVERSRALANVYLTRRDDLETTDPGEAKKHGIAILVHLEKPPSRSLRHFGVALDASVKPTTVTRLNKVLHPRMQSLLKEGEFPYPVCLFYFTMQDNGSYFTWVVEPIITEKGQPQLIRHEQAHCQLLDREALDVVVAQVHRWYDAFYATMTATAS